MRQANSLVGASLLLLMVVGQVRAAPILGSSYADEVLADNPVSYWRLEEIPGSTAADTAGSNPGTIVGGVSSASGIVGNAFKFDGSSGRVTMGNPANLNFGTTGAFSLEAWFNWDGGGSSVNNLIRKSNFPVTPPGAGYWLRIDQGSQNLDFFTGETTGAMGFGRANINTSVTSNTWHHAVATRDAAGEMRLYLDGVLEATTPGANFETTSTAPFVLGAWDDRFGVIEFFSGRLDEVAVFDSALSADRVAAHFNAAFAPATVPEPSTLALCAIVGLGFFWYGLHRRRRITAE